MTSPPRPTRAQSNAALHDRFVSFGAQACRIAKSIDKDPIGRHISLQLARSAMSPGAQYAEACEASSRADFVYKMKLCARELREAHGWLKTLMQGGWSVNGLAEAGRECNELIAITVASIRTAKYGGRSN